MIAMADRLIQDMRTVGWPHALKLASEGLQEDALTCESEGWINTTAALLATAENVAELGESIRRRLANAEQHDRAAGCD